MRKLTFNIKGTGKVVRISKTIARNLFEQGVDILFIPCNIRPDNMWGLGVWNSPDIWGNSETFDSLVDCYEIYNCNSETGRYCAYYTEVENI